MGATIYWESTKRKKKSLSTMAPSSFMELMERVFGSRTPTLGEDDVVRIETLMHAKLGHEEALQEILNAIETVGEIELTAAY